MDAPEQPVCKANKCLEKEVWPVALIFRYQCYTLILISYKDNSLTCAKLNQPISKKRSFTEVAEAVLNIISTMLNLCRSNKEPVAYLISHADPVS